MMPMFLIRSNGTVLGISSVTPSIFEKRVTMTKVPQECKDYARDFEIGRIPAPADGETTRVSHGCPNSPAYADVSAAQMLSTSPTRARITALPPNPPPESLAPSAPGVFFAVATRKSSSLHEFS
jgi:hypothetical protein